MAAAGAAVVVASAARVGLVGAVNKPSPCSKAIPATNRSLQSVPAASCRLAVGLPGHRRAASIDPLRAGTTASAAASGAAASANTADMSTPQQQKDTAGQPGSVQTKTVLVPIARGTEEIEAVCIIDVLRRAGADVTVASVEPELQASMHMKLSSLCKCSKLIRVNLQQICASREVKLIADVCIKDLANQTYDLIALPGGALGAERLRDCQVLDAMLRSQAQSDRLYAAICASPAVALQPKGLLTGHIATCHPAFAGLLECSTSEECVVVDGSLTTSRGPGTAIDFALMLVERLFGRDKADEVAGPMVMPSGDPQEKKKVVLNGGDALAPGSPEERRVLVPIADGTEEMEAVIIIDVLRRAGARVTVASVHDSVNIKASRGVKIAADCRVHDCTEVVFDAIILPGGMPGATHLSESQDLASLLRKQVDAERVYGAICASPAVVLEPQGLLHGRKATCHPAFVGRLADATAAAARVIADGPVLTSRGPGTALEYALAVVERLYGADKAKAVADPMVVRG
eukprot:jgi/Chlat1/7346/Chrsp59S06954